jgi:hypothetical protein
VERVAREVVVRNEMHQLAIETVHSPKESIAQTHGAFRDRIEYWLHVRRRARNHPEDLAGRCLLLQRLAHLSVRLRQRLVLLLQLREQSHVLNRDDGLVGERLEERDLRVTERTDVLAPDDDHPDRHLLPKEGHGERRVVAEASRVTASAGELVCRRKIIHVDSSPLQDSLSADSIRGERHPIVEYGLLQGYRPMVRRHPKVRTLDAEDHGIDSIAELRRRSRDCFENWLSLGRRARYHPQDLSRGRLLLKRHGEVTVTCLQLLEQPHVLNGDDGLVREGLQEIDLFFREWLNLCASERDHSDCDALAQ